MIQKIESLIESEYILNRLMSNYETKNIHCFVECYQNGREQGFTLFGFNQSGKSISFAKHRNMDTIRVYVGSYSMQSISDDAYNNSFTSKDNFEAIDYILKQMKQLNRKVIC